MNPKLGEFNSSTFELLAVGIYISCLSAEWLVQKIKMKKWNKISHSISNVLIGILASIADTACIAMAMPILIYFNQQYAWFSIDLPKELYFLILFILIDFIEYIFHFISHKINFFWKAHLIHHEDALFNLTVGLRSSIFIPILNLPFYFIPVILGFHPVDIFYIVAIQGIYQLLIHTQSIGKLGILDRWFVTPSAHRVHHGSNDTYLDKNFGKVLLIWDHLFGTYQSEIEPIRFGIPHHSMELNPIKAQWKPWQNLYLQTKKNPKKITSIFWGPPSK